MLNDPAFEYNLWFFLDTPSLVLEVIEFLDRCYSFRLPTNEKKSLIR